MAPKHSERFGIDFTRELARGHGAITPEALAWLRTGLSAFLDGKASLDVALGLTAGQRAKARDRDLLRAAAILDAGEGLALWQLAKQLERAIARFESDVYPGLRHGRDVPLSPMNAAIFEAFQSGATPLRSARSLYELLAENPPLKFQRMPGILTTPSHSMETS